MLAYNSLRIADGLTVMFLYTPQRLRDLPAFRHYVEHVLTPGFAILHYHLNDFFHVVPLLFIFLFHNFSVIHPLILTVSLLIVTVSDLSCDANQIIDLINK